MRDPVRDLAVALADDFAERYIAALIASLPPRRKPGRPRLIIPQDRLHNYQNWRRYYGAKMAREMIGLAA